MQKIIVLDFGGQYCHLIARRIKDLGVFSEVLPASTPEKELKKILTKGKSASGGKNLKGIILSGGAMSVYDKKSPKIKKSIFNIGVPILGICYGHQLIAHLDGGKVITAKTGEYGLTNLKITSKSKLLNGLKKIEKVWMNHQDIVKKMPANYLVTALSGIKGVRHPIGCLTPNGSIAAYEDIKRNIYGVQFHPEVSHTKNGDKILKNFVFKICQAKKGWSTTNIIEGIIEEIKQQIGNQKAIIGLSGGVDSSTAAILINKIIGKKLTCVYVDTGLMRHQETEFIEKTFKRFKLNLKIIRAGDRYFKALKGITDPEKKRKIIGKLFIEIFDEVAKREKAKILIQGTIYSDRIESGLTEHSANIKSHHNVGGLPKKMKLKIYEPLRDLYKDEVRQIARQLGLPKSLAERQVFPGPGLAIRIIGEVTKQKAAITRKAGHIIQQELEKAKLFDKVWMAFAVLLSIKSVGIQGDARSYKYPIVLRIIESKDAMTANFAKIPFAILERISTRITNEIKEVNRVVYDISNKPPATMEWE